MTYSSSSLCLQCYASLLQVVFEFSAAAGMAQLAQCLGFDLADPLSSSVKLFAYFLQASGSPVLQAESKLYNPSFSVGKLRKYLV